MKQPLSLFIGLRYSRAKSKNGFVSFISMSSTLGIMLGVAVLIIGLSAMNGFEKELRERLLSAIPHGELESPQAPFPNWPALVKQAEQNPHVLAAAPYINIGGLMQKGLEMKAVQLKGVMPELEQKVTTINEHIQGGGWLELKPGLFNLVLGKGVADKLGLKVGDSVTLLVPQDDGSLKLKAPKRQRFTLVGLVEIGGQLDSHIGFIHLTDSQTLSNVTGVSGIAFKLDDLMQADVITRQLAYDLKLYAYIKPWTSSHGGDYSDIQMVKTLMYVILLLVVSVACFNIVSTLVMAVNEKRSDIAILKTMGASNGLLRTIFIVQGLVNGLIGCLGGALIGSWAAVNLTGIIKVIESVIGHKFLSADIYFINFLPSELLGSDVALVTGVTLLMCLLATFYPAWQASQVKPAIELGHG